LCTSFRLPSPSNMPQAPQIAPMARLIPGYDPNDDCADQVNHARDEQHLTRWQVTGPDVPRGPKKTAYRKETKEHRVAIHAQFYALAATNPKLDTFVSRTRTQKRRSRWLCKELILATWYQW